MVGRKAEIDELNRLYESDESEFIAVYGRRRVGKTYLIEEVFKGRFAFSHTGLAKATKKQQLRHFIHSLNDFGWQKNAVPQCWTDAFDLLKSVVANCGMPRKVVFIDEMPWLDTAKSDFITALEAFWNGWASKQKNIVLIACGSASSWMLKNLLKNRGGLHNRITARIHLFPFSLHECEEYAAEKGLSMSRKDIAECYMALGGIPYYWHFMKRGQSLAQNFDALFFSKNAPLKSEYSELYSSLFKNASVYEKVVSALSHKKIGMTRKELIEATGIPSTGAFTDVLETLECSGFIRCYRNFGNKKHDSIYQLMDNFTLFHFRFLERKSTDTTFWSSTLQSQEQVVWRGLAFERLCLQHLPQIHAALGITGIHTEAYSWYHRPDDTFPMGTQIDMLIERADNVFNICEMKYSSEPFAINRKISEAMEMKAAVFKAVTKTRKAVLLTIITPSGLVNNSYRNTVHSEITLDNLFLP